MLDERNQSGSVGAVISTSEATRFQPGKSGNPKGRPKLDHNLRALAREFTEEALATIVAVMRNKRSPAAARLAAADRILSRGHGKPVQAIDSNVNVNYSAQIDAIIRRVEKSRELKIIAQDPAGDTREPTHE